MSFPSLALLFIVMTLSISPSWSRLGGTSSNGGGSSRVDLKNWHGLPSSDGPDVSFAEKMIGFKKAFPGAKIEACPDAVHVEVPALPEAFKDSFSFRRVGPNKKNTSLTLKDVCQSAELISSYGEYLFTLHEIADGDSVGTHLIRRTVEKGGPIVVTIVAGPQKHSGVEEHTWYDPSEGTIYYSSKRPYKGLEYFLGRRNYQFVRHEIMHVLTQRVLGQTYPTAKHWHDFSQTSQRDGARDLRWLKNKTTEGAAYVESLANAVEFIGFNDHPFVIGPGNFNSLMENEGRLFYWSPAEIKITKKRGKKILTPRLDNEIFVSSSLSAFFQGFAYQLPSVPSLKEGPSFYQSVNTERQKAYIDAVADLAPKNVFELARAIDTKLGNGSDLGYRWLREYYYFDYKSGRNISAEFEEVPGLNDTKTMGVPSSQRNLFFTPALKDEERAKKREMELAYTKLTPAADVHAAIEADLKWIDTELEAIQTKHLKFDDAKAIRLKAATVAGLDGSQKTLFRIDITKIYEDFEAKFKGQPIYLEYIMGFVRNSRLPQPFESLDKVNEARAKLIELARRSESDDESHRQKTFEYLKTKAQLQTAMGRLTYDLQMTLLIQETGFPIDPEAEKHLKK